MSTCKSIFGNSWPDVWRISVVSCKVKHTVSLWIGCALLTSIVQYIECLFHCDNLSTGSIQVFLCYERVRFQRSVNNHICYKSNHSISYHTYIMLCLLGMWNGLRLLHANSASLPSTTRPHDKHTLLNVNNESSVIRIVKWRRLQCNKLSHHIDVFTSHL